jgi:hypothetical protein
MASKINPDQLKLVMTAGEYQAHIDSSSDREYRTVGHKEISPNVRQPIVERESMEQMWSRKEAEAKTPKEVKNYDVQWRGGRGHRVTINSTPTHVHGAGIYESVKEKGVEQGPNQKSPILTYVDKSTGEKRQGEGHHRIAAAAAVERETGKQVWIAPTYVPANLPKMNG